MFKERVNTLALKVTLSTTNNNLEFQDVCNCNHVPTTEFRLLKRNLKTIFHVCDLRKSNNLPKIVYYSFFRNIS